MAIIITANNNGLVGRSRSSCSDGRRTPACYRALEGPWNERVSPHHAGPSQGPAAGRQTSGSPVLAFSVGCEPVSRSGWVRFSVASSLFDPRKPVYEREIAFESRFGVAFPGKRRSLSSLLPLPPFAKRASSSGGGLPRGFTTITRGWPDTHRRLAHDSFGDFAVRSAKSGTSEWREARLSARRLKF